VAGARIVYLTLAAMLLVAGLAACGGGKKSYTYNFAGKDASSAGIYLTIISPVKLPPSAFKGGKLVDHVTGPEDCAFTQKINKPPRRYAALLGTKLTVKVYGTAATAKFICSIIRKSGSTQIIHP
jgi:Ca2+/H+ antiporter